jgi:hypothetical protein
MRGLIKVVALYDPSPGSSDFQQKFDQTCLIRPRPERTGRFKEA